MMPDPIPAHPAAPPGYRPSDLPGLAELLTLAVFVVVVTGLYFAREVMVPITLGRVCSPSSWRRLSDACAMIHVPRAPAVLLSVVVALAVILALAGVIGLQLASLAGDLPRYQHTVEDKLTVVQRVTVGRLFDLVNQLGEQTSLRTAPAPPASNAPSPPKPLQVEVQQPPASPHAARPRSTRARRRTAFDHGDRVRGRDLRPPAAGRPAGPPDPPVRIDRPAPHHPRARRRRPAAQPLLPDATRHQRRLRLR